MGLNLFKTTWDTSGPSAWTKKSHCFSWQSCKGLERWFDEWSPGYRHYILFSPGRTADQRLPCAAASPAGCAQSFSELGVFGRVCLFAVDENQHSETMCDLMIGNDHGW